MIIVNQNKTMSLNIDNIEAIGIGNPLEHNDGKFKILINTISDNQYTVATYTTEERAREVLFEIIDRYKQICDDSYFLVYEMPEE